MPLTTEERAEKNRRNAQKSTGPRSPAGKFAASRNSTKHGLSGAGVHLPPDMQAERDALADSLAVDLRPGGEAELRLVRQMATAFVRLDHCARKESADAADRARKAVRTHDAEREDRVRAEADRLPIDPVGALAALRRTAEGRDYLADAWDELAAILADPDGAWDHTDRMFKLLGHKWLHHAGLPPDAAAALLAGLVLRGQPLDRLAGFSPLNPPPADLPTTEESRALLLDLCESERDHHAAEADRLWREVDGPDRAGLTERALVGTDEASERLRRYEASATSALHRAIHSLGKLRNLPPQDEAKPAVEPKAEPAASPAQNEATCEPPARPSDPPARNEATAEPAVCPAKPPARNEATAMPPARPSDVPARNEATAAPSRGPTLAADAA